jgi:hypothetical protein
VESLPLCSQHQKWWPISLKTTARELCVPSTCQAPHYPKPKERNSLEDHKDRQIPMDSAPPGIDNRIVNVWTALVWIDRQKWMDGTYHQTTKIV